MNLGEWMIARLKIVNIYSRRVIYHTPLFFIFQSLIKEFIYLIFKSAMDQVQEKIVKCCGVLSYKDYAGGKSCNSSSTSKNATSWSVPKSCCTNADGTNCKYKNVCEALSPVKIGIHLKVCLVTFLSSYSRMGILKRSNLLLMYLEMIWKNTNVYSE